MTLFNACIPSTWPQSFIDQYKTPHVSTLRSRWEELHRRPFACSTDDAAWLKSFRSRIPCGECRRHFDKFSAEHPPDFTSHRSYFEWTWELHESVNRKLEKHGITVDEAWSMYAD